MKTLTREERKNLAIVALMLFIASCYYFGIAETVAGSLIALVLIPIVLLAAPVAVFFLAIVLISGFFVIIGILLGV